MGQVRKKLKWKFYKGAALTDKYNYVVNKNLKDHWCLSNYGAL